MHFRVGVAPGRVEANSKIGAKLDKNILGDLNKREYIRLYLFIHSRSDSKTGYLVEPWRETVKKYTLQPF